MINSNKDFAKEFRDIMTEKIEKIIAFIKNCVENDSSDSLYKIDEAIEELRTIDNNDIETVYSLLYIIEQNNSYNFGSPGSITHYLEGFYGKGYTEALIESLKRCPTEHTIWMLNRIINAKSEDEKKPLLDILEKIYNSKEYDQKIRNLALEFRKLHI